MNKFQKWFTRDNCIILVLVGILLMVIVLPTGKSKGKETNRTGRQSAGESAPQASALGKEQEEKDYGVTQEERLALLLSSIQGVGKVEVLIQYYSSEELIVEKDAPVIRSNTVEKDSAGGSRTISSYEAGDSTIIAGNDGKGTPFVVKTLTPRVEGVVVVAQGAEHPAVQTAIRESVCALYGVDADRVSVMAMGAG